MHPRRTGVRFTLGFTFRPAGAVLAADGVERVEFERPRDALTAPSIRTDLTDAGATVVDREVAVDGNLITSRNPDDLPAFCAALVAARQR